MRLAVSWRKYPAAFIEGARLEQDGRVISFVVQQGIIEVGVNATVLFTGKGSRVNEKYVYHRVFGEISAQWFGNTV